MDMRYVAVDVLARTALVPDLLEYLVKPLLRLVREEEEKR